MQQDLLKAFAASSLSFEAPLILENTKVNSKAELVLFAYLLDSKFA